MARFSIRQKFDQRELVVEMIKDQQVFIKNIKQIGGVVGSRDTRPDGDPLQIPNDIGRGISEQAEMRSVFATDSETIHKIVDTAIDRIFGRDDGFTGRIVRKCGDTGSAIDCDRGDRFDRDKRACIVVRMKIRKIGRAHV